MICSSHRTCQLLIHQLQEKKCLVSILYSLNLLYTLFLNYKLINLHSLGLILFITVNMDVIFLKKT